MGKLFEKELLYIGHTCEEIQDMDTALIEKFISIKAPTLIIGSGGSFSAAKAIEYQFSRVGMTAKAITPLQLNEHQNVIYKSKVILLTARGNNNDILNAFQYCNKLEATILCICLSTKSKVRKEFINNGHLFLLEKDITFGKDGYLSVNSLIAMIIIMSLAIYRYTGDKYFNIQKKISIEKSSLNKYANSTVLGKETIIVLHGGSTTQVAVDLESKFSEVALGNIQLVDFRNFGHGRHYWMSERGDRTGIIALLDSEQSDIADKTLQYIPKEIPCEVIKAVGGGITAVVLLYIEMFCLVNAAGMRIGINPGKPTVPEYGKKLYHVNYRHSNTDIITTMEKNPAIRAAYRKYGGYFPHDSLFLKYKEEAELFVDELGKRKWKCLIFDYDGTLHWKGTQSETEKQIYNIINQLLDQDIRIGIATGRGKSIRDEMQKYILPQHWSKIGIGYYNGSVCGWFDDNTMPKKENIEIPQLGQLYQGMETKEAWKAYFREWEAPKPKQWSLGLDNKRGRENAVEILKEKVYLQKELKMVVSSHSIDVIGIGAFKGDLVGFLQDKYIGITKESCLFIGDAGSLGGNDFEMLTYNGLSVDQVSKSFESCWNIAPLGRRQLEATLYYLQRIKVNQNGEIEIKIKGK